MTALFTFLFYYGSLLVLVFFSCHRLYLLWLLRTHPEPPSCEGNESHRPFVTVQIPVYNERYVVGRLLDSLRQLRYPRACIELQLLDDSTDDTSSRPQHGLARLRETLTEDLDLSGRAQLRGWGSVLPIRVRVPRA